MIIDSLTQHLVGLVDWAEAEPLPFGTCFYGLEEILGEITPIGFNYHPHATYLRGVFWTELTIRIPELRNDSLMKRVRLARDLGVILWHGIAWDDGAINRVVVDGRKEDVDEIRRLDAFLDIAGNADLTTKATIGQENPSKL
ncbi:hypothetical protein SS1G_12535 [Sclerotinia sclerotiorum 1980 UF-70]|nr:hypothetical protein SS1G_12535 [Sclerotinia sclerotiorum 1980 UF-70]EDN97681.1 hypothetical protein SS1G_12535 [Sclerotinia sclerotiorum 1980 UF-70]